MLVSTYQHDYIPPVTRRYEFQKQFRTGEKPQEECACIDEPKIAPPKAVLEQCDKVEWTGIAPMGRLIEPRIIPTKLAPEQTEAIEKEINKDCFQIEPNRFLKVLRATYPDLYERLKEMPKNELNRRLDSDRMFTTYQIDYCKLNEYPEGVYPDLKQEEDPNKISERQLLKREQQCVEFRQKVMEDLEKQNDAAYLDSVDPCEKLYNPFKTTFADSTRFINSGNNSHWGAVEYKRRANFSEYMESISRTGCIITENALNNHKHCSKGKHCRHLITIPCTKF